MKFIKSSALSAFLLPGLLIISFSCQEPEEKEQRQITLAIADLEPIFATLSLHVENSITKPAMIAMTRDGGQYQVIRLYGTDTIVTDWQIKPKTTYSWQAHLTTGNSYPVSSNPVIGTTGDTTSHAFTFSLTELGGSGSSINDVWIGGENDIWVAGDIVINFKTDEVYNLMHWNGSIWEKWRLVFRFDYASGPLFGYNMGAAVFKTPEGRVWVMSDAGGISYSDDMGLHWIQVTQLKGIGLAGERIYGTSNSNMYFTGLGGGILHFNGSTFTRMPKVTDLHLTDLWGNSEGVFVMAEKYGQDVDAPILKLNGSQLERFPNKLSFNSFNQTGIWVTEKHKYLTAGYLMRYDAYLKKWLSLDTGSSGINIWPSGVRGNSDIDYWIFDSFSHLVHFNGGTWKVYPEVNQMGVEQFFFTRLAVKGELLVALGFANNRDYLITGKRK
ncbi:MAG: hypothetical protein LCH54_05900 [Bacteroidetes bacterium]|nr:hypothetical protein [Bacteroidota bacterium]